MPISQTPLLSAAEPGMILWVAAGLVIAIAGTIVVRWRRSRTSGAQAGRSAPAAAAAAAEQRLRAAIARAPIGYLLVSDDGVVRDANASAHEILGRAPRTLAGFDLARLQLADAAGGADGCAVTSFIHPDGSTRTLELSSSGLRRADGVSERVIWLADVTGRARAAEELERARTQLRRNERLETLATLAGGLAHDFNNLLAPIVGHVDLAKLDIDEGSRAHEDLDLVKAAAQRASELAHRLLRLSRPERDRVEPVSLQEILKEVLGLLGIAPSASVQVVEQLDPTCPSVLGTKTQLHQVLFNLCKNALYAMPAGGTLTAVVDAPEALATWEVSPRTGRRVVRVRVTDTGTGMDDETQKRIFEPFFTTKVAGEGSGLGLSMVRNIVTSYHGTISVRSAPGRGSTFSLVFPAHDDAVVVDGPMPTGGDRRDADPGAVADDRVRPAASAPVNAVPSAASEAGRVLVVDDDAAVLDVMARTLTRLGYGVRSFTSGPEALACFLAAPGDFDLILTDQMMPGMTGLALLELIREVRPDVPAVITTGRVDLVPRADLGRLGCALLPKPATSSQLDEAVARGLSSNVEG
jgi:signal transduction histidine kinase/CheY-like chemotaxis protein